MKFFYSYDTRFLVGMVLRIGLKFIETTVEILFLLMTAFI